MIDLDHAPIGIQLLSALRPELNIVEGAEAPSIHPYSSRLGYFAQCHFAM